MALDAILMTAVTEELRPTVTGLRIEKIRQPVRDQVVLVLRGNRKLLLCAGAGAPRVQLTEYAPDNPAEPPMFCMLLRKHLAGGRITALDQPPMERLVRLEIDAADELGRAGKRTLVLEAMGRRSNLILLDGDGRILDCLRRVDAEMSAARQVLPGLFYRPPAAGTRLPVTEENETGFREKWASAAPGQRMEKFLLEQYFGLSPLLAREIAFRACGDTDGRVSPEEADRVWTELDALAQSVRERRFTPYCLVRDGLPMEMSCFPILQYGPSVALERAPSFCQLLDSFYQERERRERARARGAELFRTVSAARERLRRKLSAQEQEYAAARDRDELRLRGDLITANLYRMTRGERVLVCENFYGAEGETASVPLDPLLTPQQNAARYYKRYTKAKTAEKYLREQMDLARRDLEYLDSVQEELERGETEQDFLDIRRELRQGGFLRAAGAREKREKKEIRRRPREFRTRSGFQILAGRNNAQNDALTRGADRRDLWFHAQKMPGSHVILRTGGNIPDEAAIQEAAAVAAYYSQGRERGSVPVDYTAAGRVRKPAGARPGAVLYTSYRTVYAAPALPEDSKKVRMDKERTESE